MTDQQVAGRSRCRMSMKRAFADQDARFVFLDALDDA